MGVFNLNTMMGNYHCTGNTILIRDIYFPLGGEKFGVCFKFLRPVIFNYNKNLKLFDNKSLFYAYIFDFVKILT